MRLSFRWVLAVCAAWMAIPVFAQDAADGGMRMDSPMALFMQGMARSEPIQVNEQIYQAVGFSNTFLIATEEGRVIVDTGLRPVAAAHKRILGEIGSGPVKYIVLTHGHGDHRMGLDVWREEGTEVVAQKNYAEMRHFQERLAGALYRRNFAQFYPMVPQAPVPRGAGNFGADVEATVLFDDEHRFAVGDVEFVCFAAPGETEDHLNVWIPKYKALFVGDNFYDSFPNIYTLRGSKTRYALDYVAAANRALELEPEIVLPSHGLPVHGRDEIRARITKYRDAVLHVHDAVVAGMNDGKDVYTLMQEISLPEELDVGESYGNIRWSVRGIYEGYLGWFDGNPANMYAESPAAIYPDLVDLAGGADAVADHARKTLEAGQAVQALRLADVALAADAGHRASLEVRLEALRRLEAACTNSNERGWLLYHVHMAEQSLAAE